MHQFLLNYTEALGPRDKEAVPRLFALNDPRFSVFQDAAPGRLGAKEMLEVADGLPSLSEPKRFIEEVKVEILGEAALVTGFKLVRVTSQEELDRPGPSRSRPLPEEKDWRILQAHLSALTRT